jgi:hypothetical protein
MKQICLKNTKENENGIAGQARNDTVFYKKRIFRKIRLVWMATIPFACINAQEKVEDLHLGDFETYETTPYIFRYGNQAPSNTGSDGNTYEPRWRYSHTVIDNPVANAENNSAKVLKYTSMEAKNYGLKILFPQAIALDKLKKISFKIYQPSNVINKPVLSGNKATTQKLKIKLLSSFNTVNDYKQDAGLLLNGIADMTIEGQWVTHTATFDKRDYSTSELSVFNNGVVEGIAILPTYNSNVTLAKTNEYLCYIDDICVQKIALSSGIITPSVPDYTISVVKNTVYLQSETPGTAVVYDTMGKQITGQKITIGENRLEINNKGIYIISLTNNIGNIAKKICIN